MLLFTSLYPVPWHPTQAVFNLQQYRALEQHMQIDYLVPVPFYLWFRHLPSLWREMRTSRKLFFPYFYIPGYFREWNLYFIALSIIICVAPAIKLAKARIVMASWAYPDALACALLQPVLDFRLFIQCLGSDINVHGEIPKRRRQLARGFRRAEAIITVSKDLARKVSDIVPLVPVRTIYNGVDGQRFQPVAASPDTCRIVFVGNLLKTKGVFELIEAFSMVSETRAELEIIGDGPARKAIEARVAQLALGERVRLLGRLPHAEIARKLPGYKLLVLPSYSEGVPNVVVEALSCGVPVVATDVGGIAEVVSSEAGILVPARDPEALVGAISQALSIEWSSEKVRDCVSHLTWEANAIKVTELVHDGIARVSP